MKKLEGEGTIYRSRSNFFRGALRRNTIFLATAGGTRPHVS